MVEGTKTTVRTRKAMIMKSYTLNMAGSGEVTEFWADSDEEAIAEVTVMLRDRGYDPVINDSWDADGENDDGLPTKRLLVWGSEEESLNDDGANAIAEVSTIGRPMGTSEIVRTTCEDLGVDDYDLRTIVIRGWLARTGMSFAAAVMLNADGEAVSSPDIFDLDGVENYEAACRNAGDDISDSYVGLLKHECRDIAERFASHS